MRIALVHPYLWTEVRRGGERYLGDLAWYLAGAGHDVEVHTTATGGGWRGVVDGIPVRASRRLRHGRLRRAGIDEVQTQALGVVPALAVARHDVVHALTPFGALAGAVARRPTVYTELGHPTPELVEAYPGGARLFRSVTRRAGAVTALSRSAADALVDVGAAAPVVVAPGVRTDRFAPTGDERDPVPVVLFVSDASGWRKGVDVAIAAVGRLLADRPDLRLRLAGPGDHGWALDRLGVAPGSPVARAVEVVGVGRHDELPGRYTRAWVTVLPSTHEAFGLALVESLACGTPVVCSDGWGMVDIVDDDAVGRRSRPGDADDLARALDEALDLAADPSTRERCRTHAMRWDWATVAGPAHEALYRRVRAAR